MFSTTAHLPANETHATALEYRMLAIMQTHSETVLQNERGVLQAMSEKGRLFLCDENGFQEKSPE